LHSLVFLDKRQDKGGRGAKIVYGFSSIVLVSDVKITVLRTFIGAIREHGGNASEQYADAEEFFNKIEAEDGDAEGKMGSPVG
jgi:hypothetical protein